MEEQEEEKASLNYDCNYNLFLAKRLIADMRYSQGKNSGILILDCENDKKTYNFKIVIAWSSG